MARQFHPSALGPESWEGYRFSDVEIRIKESTDLYGAVLWPSVPSDPPPPRRPRPFIFLRRKL